MQLGIARVAARVSRIATSHENRALRHARTRALAAGAQQQCNMLYSSARKAGARRARFDRRKTSSSISSSSAPATVTSSTASSSRTRRRPRPPSAPACARVGILYGNKAARTTHLRHRRQRRRRPCHHPAPAAQRRGLLPPPPNRREHTLGGQIATVRTGTTPCDDAATATPKVAAGTKRGAAIHKNTVTAGIYERATTAAHQVLQTRQATKMLPRAPRPGPHK